ncbi:MAG: 6-phosphofructokinase [Rickettsiales bacterium]|nr:6-phosphofructokinase [Rickettsiales bacterium]|tara:strand:+ start:284 stop:1477 length:1194 start_codon:yes stop_codon:yes gene_type:complete
MLSDNNILIAQGGGPTNVINSSLAGIIKEAKQKKINIIGSLNGVNGIINTKFISLNDISNDELKILANTTGAALGSTRDKPDEKYCLEILEILKKKKISKFFYIGGNDSSDSLRIISEKSKESKTPIQCIHVPKTIDNDLVKNDHTPGFGSAAKYVSLLFSGINFDVRSLPGVYLGIIMGRHAGFLTAATSLLKKNKSDGPNLVFIPEIPFCINEFLTLINYHYKKNGRCIVAISEGIQDKNNKLFSEKIKKTNEYDAHGNIQLSGSGFLGDHLANQIRKKLKISRVRADTLGYPQRSFPGSTSEVDLQEAFEIGKHSVKFSYSNPDSFSVGIKERKKFSPEYFAEYKINKLSEVAGKTKKMPKNFFNSKDFCVSKNFLNYALPLIGKNIPKTFSIT